MPTIASVDASLRASSRVASADTAAVRIAVIGAASSRARSWPVVPSETSTRP